MEAPTPAPERSTAALNEETVHLDGSQSVTVGAQQHMAYFHWSLGPGGFNYERLTVSQLAELHARIGDVLARHAR